MLLTLRMLVTPPTPSVPLTDGLAGKHGRCAKTRQDQTCLNQNIDPKPSGPALILGEISDQKENILQWCELYLESSVLVAREKKKETLI